MKGRIVSKKVKAGIVAATLIVLSTILFVATNVIAEIPDPDPPAPGDVYVGNVTVTLNATDEWSGVDYTMYRTTYTTVGGVSSQGEWLIYIEPFILSGRGNHTIEYYSVDNDGNIEETKTTSFSIFADVIAPVTTCILDGELK